MRLFLVTGLAVLFAVTPAYADDASRAAARDLADQGLVAYEGGKFEEAADKLVRAYHIVRLPTLAVYAARALEKTGRLVEASELYLEATRLETSEGVQATQEQAKHDAEKEQEALMARIPRLRITVKGADAAAVNLMLDGRPLARDLVDVERPTNPGSHAVVGTTAGLRADVVVTLAERESKVALLDFTKAGADTAGGVQAAPVDLSTDEDSGGSLRSTIGWACIGVGGAALVFGGVTGFMAISKKSDLDDGGCRDGKCYDDQSSDVKSYNTFRTLSTVGLAAGVVSAGAGAVLLITAPRTSAARISPFIGVGRAGVTGTF